MKKAKTQTAEQLRPEYKIADFKSPGVRGKYFAQFRAGGNVVRLSPDVAAAFPTEQAVNSALRAILRVAKRARA
jgi:hypothetical protein